MELFKLVSYYDKAKDFVQTLRGYTLLSIAQVANLKFISKKDRNKKV